MSLSFKLFVDFVSGEKNPVHYFRSSRSPPLVLSHPVYMSNAATRITDLENQVIRTDERHKHLRLISSILTDLAPGQYCSNVHRIISQYHKEALTAIQRVIFLVNSRKITGSDLVKQHDKLVLNLVRIDNSLRKALATGIANCQCEPDLSVLYDHLGQEITEELDSQWYSLYGVHLSNRPHDDSIPYNPKPNILLDLPPPGEDFVDSPFGFGASRIPKWLKQHFHTTGIFDLEEPDSNIEVEFQSDTSESDTLVPDSISYTKTTVELEAKFVAGVWAFDNEINDILDNLTEGQKKFLDSLMGVSDAIDELEAAVKSIKIPEKKAEVLPYLEEFPDVQLQTGFEKRPEFSTKVDSKSRQGVVFDDFNVSLFHTTKPMNVEPGYLEEMKPCDLEPQVVGTLALAQTTNGYKFRLGAKSHSKLDLLMRAYTYLKCDWIVKLAVRTPLGVTGKFKVVSLDANTAGAFGTSLGTTTVSDVVSREGDYWDLAAQPEFVVHVPYNTNYPVVKINDVMCGVALANYAPLSVPTGVSMPLICYISVQPVNVRFYVKKRVELEPQVTKMTLSTKDNRVTYPVPPTGAIVSINRMNATPSGTKLAVFHTNPDTEVGTLYEVPQVASATSTVGKVFVSWSPGKMMYIQEEGTVGRIDANTLDVSFVPSVETVIIQSEEVEFQGELLGTEETSVNTSDYKENYGSLGKRVEAPTGEAHVDVTAEQKIFVPVKTVNVAPPSVSGTPMFTFKVHPRNFGLNGNTGTYAPSHASLEAERFVYFGPSSSNSSSSYCTAKFTSVANAYTNARLLIAAIPPGVTEPTTVLGASQFPRCYHVLHGGETEFEIPWQSQLPIEYVSGNVAPSTIQVWLLENTTVSGQGTPQLTMWVSADGLKYSVPRSPQVLTPLT
uniref:Capsid polyprotein n=1 Tax=Bulinus globosus virus 2 TaxID=2884325 RepID=A0A8K1P6H9_9VIRU|nr:MAG: capsid polyprotein [Bulinus globosus virus 2]